MKLLPTRATLLHCAIFLNDLKAMEVLSKLNFDFNTVDDDNETAFHWLFYRQQSNHQKPIHSLNNLFSTLCFFIENKIDVSIKSEFGKTASGLGKTALDYAINYHGNRYSYKAKLDSDIKEILDKIFTTLILALLLKNPNQFKPEQVMTNKSISNIWEQTKQLINQLKKEKIKGSRFFYYDLAIEKPEIIASLFSYSIDQLSKFLNDIQSKYPIFYITIKHKIPPIQKALKQRLSLLSDATYPI